MSEFLNVRPFYPFITAPGATNVGRAPTLVLATSPKSTENEVFNIKCLVLSIEHCHFTNHGDEI